MAQQRKRSTNARNTSQRSGDASSQVLQQSLQQQIAQAVAPAFDDIRDEITKSLREELENPSQNGRKKSQDQGDQEGGLLERVDLPEGLQETVQTVKDAGTTFMSRVADVIQQIIDFIKRTVRNLAISAVAKLVRAALVPLIRSLVGSLKDQGADKLTSLQDKVQPSSGQQKSQSASA